MLHGFFIFIEQNKKNRTGDVSKRLKIGSQNRSLKCSKIGSTWVPWKMKGALSHLKEPFIFWKNETLKK